MKQARSQRDGRRGSYRVRPQSLNELDLAILEKRYRVVRATVIDIAIGGARLAFPADGIDGGAPGESLLLAVASEHYDVDRTLRARVVTSTRTDDVLTLCVAFDSALVAADLPAGSLYALFNRRSQYRHHAGARVLSAALHSAYGTLVVPVTLLDIAGGGASVLVDVTDDLRIVDQAPWQLAIETTLPGPPLRLRCHSLRREPASDGIRHACQFDEEDAASLLEMRGVLGREQDADARIAPDRRRNRG